MKGNDKMIFQRNDIIRNKETKPMFLTEDSGQYKFTTLVENFDFINETLLEGEDFLTEAVATDKLLNSYLEKGEDHKGLKNRLRNIISLNKKSDSELIQPVYSNNAVTEATETSSGLQSAMQMLISVIGGIGVWKLLSMILKGQFNSGFDAGFNAGKKHAYKMVLIVALSIIGLTMLVFIIYRIWKKKKGLSNTEKSCVNETIGNIERCKDMVKNDKENDDLVKKFDGMISKLKETLK